MNRTIFFRAVLVIVVGWLFAFEGRALTGTWEKVGGPLGGLGYDVRIDPVNPDVMYVTDAWCGVAKSIDGGNTWVEKNNGITVRTGPSGEGIPIFSLTIDPNDQNTLWAGTQGLRGIFKSTDSAETWVEKDNGITESGGISFRSFTIDPNDSNIVYCGTEIDTGQQGLEFAKQRGKIYRTIDGGENWVAVWSGDSLVRHIIIDPTDSNVIYAGTGIFDREAYNSDLPLGVQGGVGVLKSTDGGTNWTPINTGLTNLYVGYLAMHPTDHNTLYAATGNNAASLAGFEGALFVTHDGGANWSAVIPNQYVVTAVRISASNPAIRYAGSAYTIWRSENSGGTWTEYDKGDGTYGPPGVRAGVPIDLTIDPGDPYHIYVNNYGGGVFQSHNGGETWVESSQGYTGAQLHDLAISPLNYNVVFTIGRSGPFRSDDGGETWFGLGFSPASFAEWYAVEASPDNHNNLVMSDEHQGVILVSDDGGTSWTEVFRHPQVDAGDVTRRHGFKALTFPSTDPTTLYAGICRERNHINGGGNDPSFGVYVSRDGGSTWQERNSGLSALSAMNIHDIAVHPAEPGSAYAATNDSGVFKTTDYGNTWTQSITGFIASPPNLDVRSLAIDPNNPQRMFAGVEDGAIYLSLDGGNNWSLISAGMDPWAAIRGIAINPANPQIVFAADWRSGVYCTTTGTHPWTHLNAGLTTRAVKSLLFSRGGGVLYAASEGGGVFKLYPDSDEDGLLDIEEDVNDDGLRERGETDPHDDDTDDDGVDDGTDAFPTNRDETTDEDQDGMGDNFEQAIVDDDPDDSIGDIGDVLPSDDYDGDGSTNLREFNYGTDPVDPASRVPALGFLPAVIMLGILAAAGAWGLSPRRASSRSTGRNS